MFVSRKAYFHRETGKRNYIFSENTGGVNHLKIYSEIPNRDLRFYTNSRIRFFVTPNKVSVPAPATLEGDVVDTSDLTKRYDI